MNLMTGFSATDDVSLKGSPTVSPTTHRVVQRRALRLELDLDDLLRVVPGAAGVRHEDRLEEAEERDRDQVADEEERLENANASVEKKTRGRC